MSNLSTVAYPRTGKRGVPQQFPRRLYEMLESEAKLAASNPDDKFVISWSESGKAFRISDVDEFATTVLPRYFRTKKFSSFQRNLNLYGFAKVRRGPDTDMYAHSSFIRNKPELLSQLRKCASSARRRISKTSSEDSDSSNDSPPLRPVSPSPTRRSSNSIQYGALAERSAIAGRHQASIQAISPYWLGLQNQPPNKSSPLIYPRQERGKLDLLALAIEREGCFAA